MIKREEVEALLHDAEHYPSIIGELDGDLVAELARTWLAVDAAPDVDVYEMNDGRIVTDAPGHLSGQRVKLVLVPEADSGGEG